MTVMDGNFEFFMRNPFNDYVRQLLRDGTYGDQLRATSELYDIEFTIISTLGAQGRTDISPGFNSFKRTILGHFVKGYGDHYVLLSGSGTAAIESEYIEKVKPEIEDKVELKSKLGIEDRIEAEEKIEIL